MKIDAGYAFLAPVILLWAWSPLLVSRLSTGLPILEVDLLSTLFACASIALLLTARRGWKGFAACSRKDFGLMLLMGASGMFPYTLLFYLALALAPRDSANVNIINYLWPILTLLFSSLLLKERLSVGRIGAILVSFAGVCLLISGGRLPNLHATPLPAYAAAAVGAAFWALFSVLTKRFTFDPLVSVFVYDGVAALLFAIAAAGFSRLQMPTPSQWALLTVLGAAVNGLGYLFWILALRFGNTVRMAGGVYLVPFVALAYLALFGQEVISVLQVASLLLILAGPALLQWLDGRRRSQEAATGLRKSG